jgi:hypothetical protein
MELSEAILLGSTMVEVRRKALRGCALGMAAMATGHTMGWNFITNTIQVERAVKEHWPWLIEYEVTCPVCTKNVTRLVDSMVIHLFDKHVMNERDPYTLDDLVAYVASVEAGVALQVRVLAHEHIKKTPLGV